jgi:hypothetical protein
MSFICTHETWKIYVLHIVMALSPRDNFSQDLYVYHCLFLSHTEIGAVAVESRDFQQAVFTTSMKMYDI